MLARSHLTTWQRAFTNFMATSVLVLLIIALLLWPQPGQSSDVATGDHVTVRWLAPDTFAAGQTERIGFYFEVDPDWHVYWRNAGDSGAAPRFDVQVTGGVVGDIAWPFPRRLPVEHLTNLGYEGDVAYLLPVTPGADARALSLSVELEWLVCKIDCIPGFGQMTLNRPVGNAASWDADDRALRDHFLKRVPSDDTASPWVASTLYAVGETQFQLRLTTTGDTALTPQVFPLDGDLIAAKAPQVTSTDDGLQLVFDRQPGAAVPADTDLVISDGQRAWPLSKVPITAAPPTALSSDVSQPLWLLVLAAFAGGIVLNLMPCVFPVLSIKLLGLLETPASKRLYEAAAYTAGVLTTFAALGALLLLLRASGSAIGWGFQLQSAPVILGLIALFWLMALSFSGVFAFGNRIMSLAGDQRGGAFMTGMLAVFVATPCTGPFMGVALGAAAVLPAGSAMAIFLGLGSGLAAPFVLLSLSPALLNRLPKPGAWMETLRQALAFPLYLTVIWLLWVLGQLLGDTGWLIGSLLMLALVFVIWLAQSNNRSRRVSAAAITLLAFVAAFTSVQTVEPTTEQNAAPDSQWQAFTPDLIQQARAAGRAVFVDYTAAWCITCQVNKKLVLDTEPVQALFKQHNVLLVRADWTHHDPAITQALERLGRNSLPVYAWYAAGNPQPELLPQLLQTRMIRELFH